MVTPKQAAKVNFLAIHATINSENHRLPKDKSRHNTLLFSYLLLIKLNYEENCCEKRGEKVFALKKVVFLQSEKKREYLPK